MSLVAISVAGGLETLFVSLLAISVAAVLKCDS